MRTFNARMTKLMYQVGNCPILTNSLKWRLFWQVKANQWFYIKMSNPYYNGEYWIDLG